MRNFNIIICVIMLFCPFVAQAVDDILMQADSAYSASDYGKARDLYSEKMVPYNHQNLFNLGVAAYKAGDMGTSVVALRRAMRLSPSDKRINNNLSFVRSKVEDLNRSELKGKQGDVLPAERSFFNSLYMHIARGVHSNTWAVLAVVSFILVVTGVLMYVFIHNVTIRKIGFFGSIVLLIACLLFNIFAYMSASEYESEDECVVMAYKLNLLSEPGVINKKVSTPLHRGTELRILGKESLAPGDEWYKVYLNSSYIGWVRAADVKII